MLKITKLCDICGMELPKDQTADIPSIKIETQNKELDLVFKVTKSKAHICIDCITKAIQRKLWTVNGGEF